MNGHTQGPQRAADGHLPVQRKGLGERLDVHGATLGQPVDVPLTLRQQRDVIRTGRALIRAVRLP